MRPLSTFTAFRERNFAIFFSGQAVSLTGTWMERAALQAVVYELSGHDAAWLGYVGAVPALPVLLLSIPAGQFVDRVRQRHLILATQTAMMLGAGGMALLVLTGRAEAWHVLVYAAVYGAVFAVDAPARQAYVPRLVPRSALTNAIALNTVCFNVARLVGGLAFAAILGFTTLREGGCIALSALSYLPVLAALLAIRDPRPRRPSGHEGRGMLEGLRYVRRTPSARAALLLVLATAFFGFQVSHLLPVYAQDVFDQGKEGLGALHAALGLGSLTGGLALATLSSRVHRGRLVVTCGALGALSLGGFALAPSYPLALVLLAVAGAVLTQLHSGANALLQEEAPDALRGRVVSLFTLAVLAAFPLGGLAAGAAGAAFGAPATTLASAAVVLAAVIAVRATHPALAAAR